jgi:hypothetical protein
VGVLCTLTQTLLDYSSFLFCGVLQSAAHPNLHTKSIPELFSFFNVGAKPLLFLLTFNKSREWIITTLSYSTNFLSSGVLVLMRRIGGVMLGVRLPSIMGALLMMLLFTCGVNGDVVDGISDMEGMRVPPHASEACSPLQPLKPTLKS